jgi:hypothetical protein
MTPTPTRTPRDYDNQLSGLEHLFDWRYGPGMPIARRKPNPDGIISANIAGTASRHAGREPLDVDAGIAELREIANGRGDLLAEGRDHLRVPRGGRAGRPVATQST